VLRLIELESGYGSVRVLRRVSLEVRRGACVVVLGRNGVGKSTLLQSIVGLVPTTSGMVQFAGDELTGLPAYKIARRGIAFVPQGRGILPKLTVGENLIAGTRAAGSNGQIPPQIYEYFPILKERFHQLGGTLSGGQQQMLALGRALCGKPKILLLDEPSEGIQPNIVAELATILPGYHERRRAIDACGRAKSRSSSEDWRPICIHGQRTDRPRKRTGANQRSV
jgi:ABC-type branched-subunit amino acid transport system ATPase component